MSSPVKDSVVINDRWGQGVMCKHGGYLTCSDRFHPDKLQTRKWENAMTLDKNSWGYSRVSTISDYLSIEELLSTLVSTVAYGGNLLVNVGPTHDGRIVPVMEERLLQMGQWLTLNGEAIYGSKPWTSQNDTITPNVYYTQSKNSSDVFATFIGWPATQVREVLFEKFSPSLIYFCLSQVLSLGSVKANVDKTQIFFLSDGNRQLKWDVGPKGETLVNLAYPVGTHWAWALRIVNL